MARTPYPSLAVLATLLAATPVLAATGASSDGSLKWTSSDPGIDAYPSSLSFNPLMPAGVNTSASNGAGASVSQYDDSGYSSQNYITQFKPDGTTDGPSRYYSGVKDGAGYAYLRFSFANPVSFFAALVDTQSSTAAVANFYLGSSLLMTVDVKGTATPQVSSYTAEFLNVTANALAGVFDSVLFSTTSSVSNNYNNMVQLSSVHYANSTFPAAALNDTATPVPEPASLGFGLLGVVGAAGVASAFSRRPMRFA